MFSHHQNQTQGYHWEKLHQHIPHNAVHASDAYVVARANHQGQLIPAKVHVTDRKAYVPYDSKEVEVNHDVEVLVLSPGAQVQWIPASHGQVPQGAVGPFGNDGAFIGRVTCPQPENKPTPGKIHPQHKCLYLAFGGKEHKYENYEALVIQQGNQHGQSHYDWVPYHHGSLPQNAVLSSNAYAVIRANHHNEWIPGKLNVSSHQAYVPYDSHEVEVKSHVEVLVHRPGTEVVWVPASHGQVPHDAVGPIGKDNTFVGRVTCPHPENTPTPGKIHPSQKCMYLPWGGKENKYENYEVCVIRPPAGPAYQWVPYQGNVPHNAVQAGNSYVVIRANHNNQWIPGKFSLAHGQAYIPYDSHEVEVKHNIEVLTAAPGAQVQWVQASHGQVPQGAVGPLGNDNTFVGRVVCPQPENTHTPGKIHPSQKCLYLPWGGKENKYENYEVCVIQHGQHGYPNVQNVHFQSGHH